MVLRSYCAQSSAEAAEPTAGSAATDTPAWILLEVGDAWAAKPVESPALEGEPRRVLETWLAAIPGSRLQLIRRPGAPTGGLQLLLGSSEPQSPWLVRFTVAGYHELSSIDAPAVFAGRGGSGEPVDRVHLVCTHGKRDRCCARWGMPVFAAAAQLDPTRVWQTSHLGGHRFAATAVSLPSGYCFGRLDADDASPWLAAEREGRLFDLGKVRGCTTYSAPAQVADLSVRQRHGAVGVNEVSVVATEVDGDRASVTVRHGAGEETVRLRRQVGPAACLSSCGDDKAKPVSSWLVE